MRLAVTLVAIGILFLAAPAYAGLVFEQETTNYEDAEAEETEYAETETEIVYAQDNMMKIVGTETMIFDLAGGTFTMILPEHKVYATGSPKDMNAGRQAAAKQMQEEYLKRLPPEQRKMYEEHMKSMGMGALPGAEPEAGEHEVEIKKTKEKAEIGGYSCQKYQIRVDGELSSEVWITAKVKLGDELDFAGFMKVMAEMGSGAFSVKNTPEYASLMEEGLPMKTVEYDEGGREVVEITRVEKKKLPDSEFLPPEGYKKVDLADMGKMMH